MKPSTSSLLDTGDAFPPLDIETLNHGKLSLPNGKWTVLVLYRGVW